MRRTLLNGKRVKGSDKRNVLTNNTGVGTKKYSATYHPKWAYKYALLGLSDIQICNLFEIAHGTIDNWKRLYPGFKEMLNAGKEQADAKVAHAMYKRATGFTRVEEQLINTKLGPVKVDVEKYYPPDTKAASKWLSVRTTKNAIPFREVKQTEVTSTNFNTNLDAEIDTRDIEEDEILKLVELGYKIRKNGDGTSE